MRGSPPCAVALHRFGVWRAAVALIGLAVAATLCAWAVSTPSGPASPWIVVAAALGSLGAMAVCVSLWRPAAGTLRWDGQAWTFHRAQGSAGTVPGELTASVDLGAFILLRFMPAGDGTRARPLWLPAQRRGLEREWHAFRCAVYSPRPAAGPVGSDAPAP